MTFELTKDYLTGIEQIDREHAKLIEIINETGTALNQETTEIQTLAQKMKEDLTDYTVTHFRHEEEYMEKIDDPELPLQKTEHAAFIKQVQDFSIDDSIKARDLEEMIEYLVRWLFRHILHSDRMIGKIPPRAEDKETTVIFTDKYVTGIPSIDKEHKKLFEIVGNANDLILNNLLHDKYDEIIDILNELRSYTQTHFSHEEEYMKKIGYPGLASQSEAHSAFIDKLEDIDFNELEFMDDNQREFLQNLIEFLLQWLSSHILGTDKRIGEWERQQKTL